MPTLLAEPARHPAAAKAEPAVPPPDPRRRPARGRAGSGSKAPGGAARSPARKARQASKSARVSVGHRPGLAQERRTLVDRLLRPRRPCRRAAGRRRRAEPRRTRSGSTRPARAARAVIAAPMQLGGRSPPAAARATPCPGRWPDRPTRCTHRATPPGRPTWTVRSAVPMSTPSSRLVLVTTARTSPDRSPASIARWRSTPCAGRLECESPSLAWGRTEAGRLHCSLAKGGVEASP